MNKFHYVEAVFSFCVITMALFLYLGHFTGNPITTKFYYTWIKLQDLLLVFGFSLFLKGKRKLCCYAISAFYLIRVIWQVFELENFEAANQPYMIDLLFIAAVITMILVYALSKKSRTKNIKQSDSGN